MCRFLLPLLLILSCASPEMKPTEEEKQEMIRLYLDLQTAKVVMDRATVDEKDSLESAIWAHLEKIHGAPKTQLEEKVEMWSRYPEMMKDILQEAEKYADSLKIKINKELNN